MLPQGMGRWLRMMISGALLLSLLIASIAQAPATGLRVVHAGIHPMTAAQHDCAEGMKMPVASHGHTGLPCKDHDGAHGLPCCCGGGSAMMFGTIAVPTTLMPAIVPAAPAYLNKAAMPPDGLQFAPTVPPPRAAV
jgi:hypothetical protein